LDKRVFIRFSTLAAFTALPAFIHAGDQTPNEFKIECYTPVWEHNPFTFPKPAAPKRQPSVFNKLFLVSWLKEGDQEVVFVQNSETNQVQKITAELNQNNLRLIQIHLDPNPQLVAAVLCDGNEQGSVKFRFNAMAGTRPEMSKVEAAAQMPDAPFSQTSPGSPANCKFLRPWIPLRLFRWIPRSRTAFIRESSGFAQRAARHKYRVRSGVDANRLWLVPMRDRTEQWRTAIANDVA
jgi:hypothetical protein